MRSLQIEWDEFKPELPGEILIFLLQALSLLLHSMNLCPFRNPLEGLPPSRGLLLIRRSRRLTLLRSRRLTLLS